MTYKYWYPYREALAYLTDRLAKEKVTSASTLEALQDLIGAYYKYQNDLQKQGFETDQGAEDTVADIVDEVGWKTSKWKTPDGEWKLPDGKKWPEEEPVKVKKAKPKPKKKPKPKPIKPEPITPLVGALPRRIVW